MNCCSYARAALARTLAVFVQFHSAKRWHIPRTTSLLHKQLRFDVKDHVEINGNPSQAALAAENIQRLLGGSRGPAVEKERGKLTLKHCQRHNGPEG